MITVFIKLTLFPEKEKEFKQTIQAIKEKTKKIKDCINFHIYSEIDQKSTYCLMEEWRSHKALESHLKSDIFSILMGALNLLSEKPLMTISNYSEIINEDTMELSDEFTRSVAIL